MRISFKEERACLHNVLERRPIPLSINLPPSDAHVYGQQKILCHQRGDLFYYQGEVIRTESGYWYGYSLQKTRITREPPAKGRIMY